MSEKAKWELKLSAISILIALAGSIAGTIWASSKIAHQVEVNTKHLDDIDGKIEKLSEILLKEKR